MTSTMEQLLDSSPVDWSAVQQRIEENPDEIRWVNNDNRTVLHFACGNKAPLDELVFLLERHPDAARTKDNTGWLPFHDACSFGQSVAVIELLIEAYPDSLNVTDNIGKTPLHYAKGRKHADITAYLESVTAESVKTRQAMELIDRKLITLEKALKADIKTIETHLKFAIFFCIVVLITFLNTSIFFSDQLNTTCIALVDDTKCLDRHDGNIMGVLPTTVTICFRKTLVSLCIGILSFVLYIYSKHFFMIYHAFLKQAFIIGHKANDLYFCFLESVKGKVTSH